MYKDEKRVCQPCYNACDDCFGPTQKKCNECKKNYRKDGDSTCTNKCSDMESKYQNKDSICSNCSPIC